jgi:hypothetical protein
MTVDHEASEDGTRTAERRSRVPLSLSREGVAQMPRRGVGLAAAPSAEGRWPGGLSLGSGGCGRQGVSVELEEVVGGGDQAPFRAGGHPASAFEASDASVGLDLAEDRLDHPEPS